MKGFNVFKYDIEERTQVANCRRCLKFVYRCETPAGVMQVDADTQEPHRCEKIDKRYQIEPGAKSVVCRDEGCNARTFWSRTENDKPLMVDPDGGSHFETCLAANKFSKGKKGGDDAARDTDAN